MDTKDNRILKHITHLTEREEQLFLQTDLSANDVSELHRIRLELDQYWDLLRQRRAFRNAGGDPERAQFVRPIRSRMMSIN